MELSGAFPHVRPYGLYSPIILTHTASPKPVSAPTACCPSFSQLSSPCDRHLQCRLLRGGLTRSGLSLSQTVGDQMVALPPPGLATVNPRPSTAHWLPFYGPISKVFPIPLVVSGQRCRCVLQSGVPGLPAAADSPGWSLKCVRSFLWFLPLPAPLFSISSSIMSTWTFSDSASCWHGCALKQQGTRCEDPVTWPLSPTAS